MTWWRRLREWLDGTSRDRAIAEELRTHLEMAAARYAAEGLTPAEARHHAEREFGNQAQVRQATREVWRWAWLEQVFQDIGFGARILWRAPAVSVTAVALVGLVVGGNTTVYAVVRMLLTSPAAGVSGGRIVVLAPQRPASDDPYLSYPNFVDLSADRQILDASTGWTSERLTVAAGGASHAVTGGLVAGSFFEVFGVRPRDGRLLTRDDDVAASGGLVAVVSERFWTDRLGRLESVVGHRLLVNRQPVTIVGVAGNGFRGATLTPGEDLWLPLVPYYQAIGSDAVLADRAQRLVLMAARRPAGRSLQATQLRVSTAAAQLADAHPDANRDQRVVVSTYSSTALLPISRMSGPFLALLGVVTMLTVVIVSANVANLMLVRAIARQREIAVRVSMGATRGRVARLLVTEGLAVALVAWGVASAVAWTTSRAVIRLVGPGTTGIMDGFAPDWSLAGYAMALAMAAAVTFTTVPGLRAWRQPVLPWLKSGEQSIAGGRSRTMSALVVAQLAFSTVLLTSAGLAYRSLSLLDSGEVGFDPGGLLLVTMRNTGRDAFVDRAMTAGERAAAFERLARVRDRAAADGRIAGATYLRRIPGPYLNTHTPVQRGDGTTTTAIRRQVGPGYLGVLGLAPLLGRDLHESDARGRRKVAVVNQHLAASLWPEGSPIGQSLQLGPKETVEVVGVAPNVLYDGPLHERHPRYVFVAEQQSDGDPAVDATILVRHRTSTEDAADAVGSAVAAVDPDMPVVAVATMASRLALVTEMERTITRLLVAFAALALVVAGLGLYGLAAFDMRRRLREFGVRVALGATPRRLQGEVLRQAARLAVIGLLVGGAAGAALAGVAGRFLSGVTPTDPITYAGVAVILGAATALAAIVPARQAGTVNVTDVLRQE